MSVENKPEIKAEIKLEANPVTKPGVQSEIKPELNTDNLNSKAILENEKVVKEPKNKRSWKSFRIIKFETIRKMMRPNFFTGLIIGSALSYYIHFYQMRFYLNTKQTFLNEELFSLQKQIQEIKANRGI